MLNKVIIIGRVGNVPTVRQAAGKSVASFSVATSEVWTQDGKRNERTEWHRIIAWGKLGDICGQYVTKGQLVYIEGKLATRKWTDKAGAEKNATEILADTMKMLSAGNKGGKEPEHQEPPAEQVVDDVPF